jgi:hypothetical protein
MKLVNSIPIRWFIHSQVWWFMPVIPVTQEAEIMRIGVWSQSGQKLARPPPPSQPIRHLGLFSICHGSYMLEKIILGTLLTLHIRVNFRGIIQSLLKWWREVITWSKSSSDEEKVWTWVCPASEPLCYLSDSNRWSDTHSNRRRKSNFCC